jgi:hypothetical protein
MPIAPTVDTTAFGPTVDQLMLDAYAMLGRPTESVTQEDARRALRHMQMMLLHWSNRGVYVWGVDSTSFVTAAGEERYALPERATRVFEVVKRDATNRDETLSAIDRSAYNALPDKTRAGEPTLYYHQELQAQTALYLWPVPTEVLTVVVWFSRQLGDVLRMTQVLDIPTKFIPAAVSGLASRLAMFQPGFDATAINAQALDEFTAAWAAQRQRVDVRFHLG